MNKWFICQNEFVSGPFSTEQVQSKLQASEFTSSDLIWGRGLKAWTNLRGWMSELPHMNADTYVEPTPEQWHYALAGKSHGPYNRSTLIAELKRIHQIGEVMLWTKGMKEWASLFEFHDVLSEIGVNKRTHPRADITGKAIIKCDGQVLIAPTLTISEGGLGVQLEEGLVPGQAVTVEIQAPALGDIVHARADVRYISNGVMGLKFSQINSEAKGAIIQLIRQNTTKFVLKAA